MDFEAIKKAAAAYGPDMTRFLRDMIAIPSESCEEKGVAHRIAEEMKKLGYDKVEFDALGNVIGWMGSGDKIIAIDSHIDTVGIGNRENWTHDPYEGYEDQQKGNYDIVMPLAAPWTFAEILPYLLWTLLGIVVILLIVWIIKVRKSRKSLFHHEKPAIPPYVLAMKALEEIKKEKLWQSGKTKEYYTQLTDTIRNYLDGELGISAMEQTSFETLKALEKCEQVDAKQRDKLADMFETADFVKFAKAEPLQDENVRNLDIAYDFVQETNDTIRAEHEKERLEQELKEQQEREAREKAEKEEKETGEEKDNGN